MSYYTGWYDFYHEIVVETLSKVQILSQYLDIDYLIATFHYTLTINTSLSLSTEGNEEGNKSSPAKIRRKSKLKIRIDQKNLKNWIGLGTIWKIFPHTR